MPLIISSSWSSNHFAITFHFVAVDRPSMGAYQRILLAPYVPNDVSKSRYKKGKPVMTVPLAVS